jgi:hypothetical protein
MRALVAAAFLISTCVALADSSTAHAPGTAVEGAEVQTYCVACTAVVQALGANGCKTACSVLPDPASQICTWMVDYLSMCADIENWLKQGLSDEDICTHLGYCGSGCQCGVCTEAVAGPSGRCLGFPNDCGHNASAVPAALFGANSDGAVRDGLEPQTCFDGQCGDPKSVGCCLTCF